MRSGHQTKRGALLETCLNTASGFILSYLLWVFVIVDLYDLDTDFIDNFNITCIFTALSIVRGYVWRRLMTKVHKPKVEEYKGDGSGWAEFARKHRND
jgi:hypothetical protein